MATQVIFAPGATTSNVSLPAWAPDIMSMPTTTVTGWEIITGTTGAGLTTRATAYTTRTFNAKTTVGHSGLDVKVVYNKVNEFVRT